MKAFIFSVAMFGSFLAQAGAISGGGGKGVVCRDSAGEITSATTLDLYEGKAVYGVNVVESDAPLTDQLRRALEVIPPGSRYMVEAYVAGVMEGLKIVHGIALQPIDDALIIALPRGCAAEQLANYYTDSRIIVNGDIWDKMSITAQASLVMHEAVYAVERVFGTTDSRRTRHVVAKLFASDTAWSDVSANVPAERLTCVTQPKPGATVTRKATSFYAYKTGEGAWRLQFIVLNGNWVMSTKAADFTDPKFDLSEAKSFTIEKGEDQIGAKWGTAVRTVSDFEGTDTIYLEKRYEAVTNITGRVMPGFQMPLYYLSYKSGTYPGESFEETRVNCAIEGAVYAR